MSTKTTPNFLKSFQEKFCVTSQVRGLWAVVNGKLVINFGSAGNSDLDVTPDIVGAQVRANSRWLRARLIELGFNVPPGESPIIPVAIGSDMVTLMASRHLTENRVYLNSLIHPSVPQGQGILRIALTAMHSHEHMQTLVEAFTRLREYLALIRHPMLGPAHMAWQVTKSKLFGDRPETV